MTFRVLLFLYGSMPPGVEKRERRKENEKEKMRRFYSYLTDQNYNHIIVCDLIIFFSKKNENLISVCCAPSYTDPAVHHHSPVNYLLPVGNSSISYPFYRRGTFSISISIQSWTTFFRSETCRVTSFIKISGNS